MKTDTADRKERAADELDARARLILRALVQEYAETGEPVASNTLARQPGIELSPASVRSVLADLEALGYLDKPHTSAGRVPTEKGYRFYVDVLVRLRPVGSRDKELIDQRLDPVRGVAAPGELLADTSRLLHVLTRHAGVASTPREEDEVFRTIEFVRLREDRVLAVCVTGAGQVRNRLLHVEASLDQSALDRASRYLQERLGHARGQTMAELRRTLLVELESERAAADALARQALMLGTRVLEAPEAAAPVVVQGETSLAAEPTLGDVEKLRRIFRALDEKERLAQLLERVATARELTLFIGEETGLAGAADLAVVASPYGAAGGGILGAIGVIGPARMSYARVIPIVEYTARALSRSLGGS